MLVADLNWLPTSLFKGIPYPTVVYEDPIGQEYGGYYEHGSAILTVVESSTTASSIAHEFRHYQQEINGVLLKATNFEEGSSYEESIKNYFLTSLTEWDALLFEVKYAKDWCNEWWLRKLVLEE